LMYPSAVAPGHRDTLLRQALASPYPVFHFTTRCGFCFQPASSSAASARELEHGFSS
jgi:hypothetical protein